MLASEISPYLRRMNNIFELLNPQYTPKQEESECRSDWKVGKSFRNLFVGLENFELPALHSKEMSF